MDYQVMECRYNYSTDDADILFATNDREEAIEAANKFGEEWLFCGLMNCGIKPKFLPLLTKQVWESKSSRFSAKESELVRQDIAEFITRRVYMGEFRML